MKCFSNNVKNLLSNQCGMVSVSLCQQNVYLRRLTITEFNKNHLLYPISHDQAVVKLCLHHTNLRLTFPTYIITSVLYCGIIMFIFPQELEFLRPPWPTVVFIAFITSIVITPRKPLSLANYIDLAFLYLR